MSNSGDSSNDNDIEINNSNDTSFDIPTVSERVKATSFQDLLAKATAERLQQTNRIVDQSITQTTTALEEWRARNAAKQDQKDIDSESEQNNSSGRQTPRAVDGDKETESVGSDDAASLGADEDDSDLEDSDLGDSDLDSDLDESVKISNRASYFTSTL